MKSFEITLHDNIYIHISSPINYDDPIVVTISDIFIDCLYYKMECIIPKFGYMWVYPLDNRLGKIAEENNLFPGFVVKIHTKEMRVIYTEKIVIHNVSKKIEYNFSTPPYDQIGAPYIDFFYGDLCKNIDFNGIVVDAGANVGFFTLYSILNGSKRIYSIEPDPLPFYYLSKNFENNPSVININKGLSHNTENFKMNICLDSSVSSSNIHKYGNSYELEVECIDIPSILLIEKKINLLKLDIEGSEFLVMKNLPELIFKKIDQFFIEFHDISTDLIQILENNGFKTEYRYSDPSSISGFIYAKNESI